MVSQYDTRQDFAPAPVGARVRWTAILLLAVALVVPVVIYFVALRTGRATALPMILVSANLPIAFIVIWLLARVSRYRFEGDELVVEIGVGRKRFPLAALQSVEADPKAMSRALRVFGNGGLGSISGRFYSGRLGRFRAYVTDTDKAIVLRWADRTLVLSPDQSQLFIEAARARLGTAAANSASRMN